MKRSPVLLFVLAVALVMAACAPGQLSVPTPTPTNTVLPTPTATPTLTPSPTETPTATAVVPPPELLVQLNLNPDRTYNVENNYYVDTYNGAKWAKLDNGVWVETTLEEKYGDLAPKNPTEPYQELNTMGIGDRYHSGDSSYKSYTLNAFWTGDKLMRQVMDQGVQINENDGLFVIRDLNGEIKLLSVRLDSPDVQGVFWINTETEMPNNGGVDNGWQVGDPADLLSLGQQIGLEIYYQAPGSAIVPSRCSSDGICTDEYNAGMRQFWVQKAETQAFMDALRTGREIPEEPELVLVPMWIIVKK